MKTTKEIFEIISDELEEQAEKDGYYFVDYLEDERISYDGSINLRKLVEKLKELDIIQYSEDETANKLDCLIEQKKVVI